MNLHASAEIAPQELVAAIEAGEPFHVLDVRAAERLAAGRVDIVPDDRFHNVKGSELMALGDPRAAGLDPESPLAVVCGFGNDSRRVAAHLAGRGFRAASLAGGMVGWMGACVRRELAAPPPLDRLIQFDRIGKGALGYLLVSEGEAFAIDPSRHLEPWLETVAQAGARLVGVADTHAHADYISGGPALAARAGVPYRLHPLDAVYPYDGRPGRLAFEPLEEAGVVRFGRAELRAVHTPGHTEGSLSYRLGDHAVFTGDFVFIRSVGRPDLGGRTEEWTAVLWRSLERARDEWAAAIEVCPAHYASAAERESDFSVHRPFGTLPGANAPLAMRSEEEFAAWVRERAGKFPEAYRRIKAINVGLETAAGEAADELEAGRNECALG